MNTPIPLPGHILLALLLGVGVSTAACSDQPVPEPSTDAPVTKLPGAAPATFKVRFETTEGDIVVEANRAWAPRGVDRFHELVTDGFFTDIAFYRVIPGFMAQFGIHGDPATAAQWRGRTIADDPVTQSNTRGMISYAKTNEPGSRTTQLFINFGDNRNLDKSGFAPIARVVEGMDVVDRIFPVGDGPPRGPGPAQPLIQAQGNPYLKKAYPDLDYIESATVLP